VTVRTLWNWIHREPQRRGRPPYDDAARLKARRLVSAEWRRQGRSAGWRPIAKALEGIVSVRLVQESLCEIKLVHRTHEARQRQARRETVTITMRNALWSVDAAQMGRDHLGAPIRSQVGRDVASRKSVALGVMPRATGSGTVTLLIEAKRLGGGLPLVIASDNGSENVNADVAELLERERVIHLKNLPHTPKHNASAERLIGELRAETGIRANDVLEPSEARTRLEAARVRLDKKRLRRCLGYRSAHAVDAELPLAYNRVSRTIFYDETRRRVNMAVKNARSPREQRRAEREAILSTMEKYGLLIRTRGDQGRRGTKAERYS